MEFKAFVGGLMAATVVVCASGPVTAASAPRNIVPEASKAIPGGVSVQVLIAQSEINSNINAGGVAVAAGGGLVAALIDAKIEADRAKRAETEIAPLRTALTGFDVDALALETTTATIARNSWFTPAAPAFGRDSSVLGKSALLDASSGDQLALFEYIYDLSPDFSSLRVSLNMQFASKAIPEGKKPETRLQPRQMPYTQIVTSVIVLPAPGDMHANAARWAADDGRLARLALKEAFSEVGALSQQALALSAEDLKAMGSKEKKNLFLNGYAGRVQEQGANGTLLFNGGLTRIETISE